MCSHKTKTQAHGQRNKNHQPCVKQDTNTELMRILIFVCVHTKHDHMIARSQWKTQTACHTAQDITWMHTADKNTNCVHTTRHVDRRAHGRVNSRPHTHTTRQNTKRECPSPVVMETLILSRDSFIFSSFTKMIRSDSFTDSFSDHLSSRWRKRVSLMCYVQVNEHILAKKLIWLY